MASERSAEPIVQRYQYHGRRGDWSGQYKALQPFVSVSLFI